MIAITTAIAVIYVVTATKMYESQAELLITPVTSSEPDSRHAWD